MCNWGLWVEFRSHIWSPRSSEAVGPPFKANNTCTHFMYWNYRHPFTLSVHWLRGSASEWCSRCLGLSPGITCISFSWNMELSHWSLPDRQYYNLRQSPASQWIIKILATVAVWWAILLPAAKPSKSMDRKKINHSRPCDRQYYNLRQSQASQWIMKKLATVACVVCNIITCGKA